MIELMLFFLLLAIKGCKRNKKGWMKIFEASIAITLIMGFMVLVYSQTIERPPAGENLMVWQNSVLDNLKSKPHLRQEILDHPEIVCDYKQGGLVYSFIFERILKAFPGFGFSCRVCEPGEICGIQSYHEEVYSEERIIAATLTTFSPKKIKLFVWPLEPGEEIKPVTCTTIALKCSILRCEGTTKIEQCSDGCATSTKSTLNAPECMDTTAPQSIQKLVCGTPEQYLNLPISCVWTNPTDADLNEINVYLNNNKIATLTKTQTSYSILSASTPYHTSAYIVSIKTKDINGNEQTTGTSKSCTVTRANQYTCY